MSAGQCTVAPSAVLNLRQRDLVRRLGNGCWPALAHVPYSLIRSGAVGAPLRDDVAPVVFTEADVEPDAELTISYIDLDLEV